MSQASERPEVKYLPCHCSFLGREVWAVMTRQADGGWHAVNCLDKEKDCAYIACFFANGSGAWPFEPRRTAAAPQTGA